MGTKGTWRWGLAALAGFAVLLVTAIAPAIAQAPSAPVNDNYLGSLSLNSPNSRLDRVNTLVDHRSTVGATVQSDIFNPPSHGGPAELTGCAGVSEGATVWYDFYPDANGLVRIRTSGLDTINAVMPFNTHTLLPNYSQRRCVVNMATSTQELFYTVQAGRAYTVQIGGVNGATGALEFLFDYLVRLPRLQADATLTALPRANGVQVVGLSVSAPRKARVQVVCSRGCPTQAKTAATVSFPRLRGAVLPSGSRLKIFVTAKNEIGAYIEYRIRRAGFSKVQRCLAQGSHTPVGC